MPSGIDGEGILASCAGGNLEGRLCPWRSTARGQIAGGTHSVVREVTRRSTLTSHQRPRLRVRLLWRWCDDGTGDAVVDAAGSDGCLSLLDVRLHSAGASRAAGIRAALAATTTAPEQIWLANTDADSVVPPHWLCGQVDFAESGADAVLGTVEPDPRELDKSLLNAWARRHRFVEDHPHVFGANFGVRASHYLRVGGPDTAAASSGTR